MTCPAHFPFIFAIHPWFVINRKGVVSRWGISFKKHSRALSWGYLNKNIRPPFDGIEIFSFVRGTWKGKVLSSIEGDQGSLAEKMTKLIDQSNTQYPYTREYSLTGPNSNTYIQWVLNKFPESQMKLPWNAFYKNYSKLKIKK